MLAKVQQTTFKSSNQPTAIGLNHSHSHNIVWVKKETNHRNNKTYYVPTLIILVNCIICYEV